MKLNQVVSTSNALSGPDFIDSIMQGYLCNSFARHVGTMTSLESMHISAVIKLELISRLCNGGLSKLKDHRIHIILKLEFSRGKFM